MELTVREAARLFRIPEREIRRGIDRGELAAHRVHEQYRLHRAEILEWATSRGLEVAGGVFRDASAEPARAGLKEALEGGGVVPDLPGETKEDALKALLGALPLPPGADRSLLLGVLLAREALASTAVGDGIAIPHVRSPIVLTVERPLVTLAFLRRPVEFGSLDGRPVHTLFTLVCPTVKSHLQILSRLAFALQDGGFQAAIRRRSPRDEILREAARVDARLAAKGAGEGTGA